ncbi:hypothetical protein TheveDRAFT_1181 [Thermanaerovibrio velox DSM 12556]|uniref:Uncharacterized protein n=1 Tax=Thermanaerovibrio velox DSM 12556 TaxID=926567 RepID=H0USL6_9BACT|nr:hypothetical protein [Thermanaerovibrio velox]EHM10305.1 hypothetical protein TheveDRAFT_1181 [Thermanaerovibrio velox DSM 12556]
MRFLARTVATLLMLMGICGAALAHPPSKVDLSYDGSNLYVTVVHEVSDPTKHYVSRLSVFVGGKLVEQREYKDQSGVGGLMETVALSGLPKGAEVKVVAVCSIMGTASGTLVVK